MDTKEKILEVFQKGYTMNVSTVDSGGVWVSALTYIHDNDLNLYWMSSPKVRHSVALETNKNVAGNITVSGMGSDNLGVQFAGAAQAVASVPDEVFENFFKKRGQPVPPKDDPSLGSRSWYRLTPTFFELIDQKNLGFKKMKLEL